MENISLWQVGEWLAFLIAFITAIIKLKGWTTTAIKETLKEELKTLKENIKDLDKKIDKEDKEKTKNYLVNCLADLERGQEWTAVERQRFYEQYDHYTTDLMGNTYIKTAVEQYEKAGKIWRQQE